MPMFSIPLSGLQANSTALNTIGNNLANLNTTAFKDQTVNFSDMFYQTIGTSGTSAPLQVGTGVRVSSVQTDMTSGNLNPTGNTSNMAINGLGFFVVEKDGTPVLTRSGDFQLGPTGDLLTPSGASVMGYGATNGVVNPSGALAEMHVPIGSTLQPKATTALSLSTNLDATAAVGTEFRTTTPVYDSAGTVHTLSITFEKTAANQWDYTATLPSGEATTTSGNTGTLTFNPDGTLNTPNANVTGISFSGLASHGADLSLTWTLQGAGASVLTQNTTVSAQGDTAQDGFAGGNYQDFKVDAKGVIRAQYSGGQTVVLGQIAIATVANPDALERTGSNTYAVSQASGSMVVGVAGSGGRGSVMSSTLEQSNVDIASEFAKLIVAQRSFEANSKTVTAYDSVTQNAINMIR